MKRVIVCCKWVPDGADLRVDERTRKLNLDQVKWTLNDFDRNAIEAGAQVKAATGCELVGITVGVNTASASKDVLSRGLDAISFLNDPLLERADSRTTSKTLAALVEKLGGADLIICSEASDDEFAQQTSARLAALLGYASVTYVQSITVAGDSVQLSRKLEEGSEDVTVTGPLVISVVPDINDPPIPGIRQILGAKKKPSTLVPWAELGITEAQAAPQLITESIFAPEVKRKKIQLTAGGISTEDAVHSLLQHLASDGVI
jgi:electron transfer flavoprotein beta subunit